MVNRIPSESENHNTFSSNLHGIESLAVTSDLLKSEIKLLEQIEFYVEKRTHLDHDYAEKLSKLHLKIPLRNQQFLTEGSLINKAWITFLVDSEHKSKAILNSAKSLSHKVLPDLNALISQKKVISAMFQKKTLQLQKDFSNFQNNVTRLESRYKDNLNEVAKCHKKLDELRMKAKEKVVKEWWKCKENLENASRKLHMSHNEYVLALIGINEYEGFFKARLKKNLLNSLEKLQEQFVDSWKGIFSDMFSNTRRCNEEVMLSEREVECSIKFIETSKEYDSFIEKYKQTGQKLLPHKFSPSLTPDLSSYGLQENILVMNNLTEDEIYLKERRLQEELGILTTRRKCMESDYEKQENLLNEMIQGNSNDANWSCSTVSHYAHCCHLNLELTNLECQNEVNQVQLDSITLAVAQVGIEGVKQYMDPQISDDIVESISSKNKEKTIIKSTSKSTSKKSKVFFGRKIAKPELIPPPSNSRTEFSTSSPEMPATFDENTATTPISPKRKPALSGRSLTHATIISKSAECMADISTENSPFSELETSIAICPWYHGKVDRKMIASLLNENGDFIVREKNDDSGEKVLSLLWENSISHFILNAENGQYRFEVNAFSSIPSLINYHYRNSIPIQSSTGASLLNPIQSGFIMHYDITMSAKLGSGHFGDVYEGMIISTGQPVAVKTCKEQVDEKVKEKFISEAEIMKVCNHPNVIKLLGISTDCEPYYIVLELCAKGDLNNLLKAEGCHFTISDMYRMAIDTARGMEYLEEMSIIHRDLAARNCLVTIDYSVKISDFGMSHEEDENGIYQMRQTRHIPIKWCAPEVWNHCRYSSKSDVWSYGVLLWEIFSKGSCPYPNWNNQRTTSEVDRGYRLPPPNGTPQQLSEIMKDCWFTDFHSRPSFHEIVERLDTFDLDAL